MPKLIIINNSIYIRGYSKAKVYLDNKKIGTVKKDETEYFEIEKGTHKLKVGYGPLAGMSNEIEIHAINDEPIHIRFKHTKYSYLILLIIVALLGLSYILHNEQLIIAFIISAILITMIQRTIMFKIEEIKEKTK